MNGSLVLFMALGGLSALSLWVALRAAFPPPVPLAQAVDRLNNPVDVDTAESFEQRVKRRLGLHVEGFLEGLGSDLTRVRRDALITETPLHVHLGGKVTAALIGPAFIVIIALLLATAGIYAAVPMLLLLALGMAALGFFGSDLVLHQLAEARRNTFRVAFTSWLNLVYVAIGTGLNYSSAMVAAAGVGDSWAYQFLRRALDVTDYEDVSIATVLHDLGTDLGVKEPQFFGYQIGLATEEGAKIRQEIANQSEALRVAELARLETIEQRNSVRMVGPGVLLGLAFMILIGFPAVNTVLST